ncbi:MAG TPA: DciA family protein [Xanthobacteraceae bacterium]|jgi:hypothetical protein|nr:DciA family protein [Xanthobacteraceae bacterium]
MNKPGRMQARPLADLVRRTLADTFARQGFASTELVTHWNDIVGAEIAAHCEPMRIKWPRGGDMEAPEPATLILRVEGPVAIEIQHLSPVILERVNRFFGWRAVGRLALRQAPLARRAAPPVRPPPDPELTARLAATLDVADEDLRNALARLGAAIKRT